MPMTIKSITVHQLKKMMDEQQKFQLIDCREEEEYEFCTIGGELIPVGDIEENIEKIMRDIPVIVYCHTGMRSARVIAHLQRNYGLSNLLNLSGGIHAWSREIDPSVPQY
jgi:adenylyltransferase/sulfurtransferase